MLALIIISFARSNTVKEVYVPSFSVYMLVLWSVSFVFAEEDKEHGKYVRIIISDLM